MTANRWRAVMLGVLYANVVLCVMGSVIVLSGGDVNPIDPAINGVAALLMDRVMKTNR